MDATIQIVTAVLIMLLVLVISKSIIIPKASTAQAIMLFGRFYTAIENIEGKKFNKNSWDLVDLQPGETKGLNIYFFLWPFFSVYTYEFSYTKSKKIAEVDDDDMVAWKNESSGECIVVRKGISNHVKFRVEYPSVTARLDTRELASINLITTHVIEMVNIVNMLFKVDNWFVATMSKIDATLKGLVSKKNLLLLNRFSSEDKGKFSAKMLAANHDEPDQSTGEVIPGLNQYGIKLFQSAYRDFEPADDSTRKLTAAHLNVSVFKAEGEANLAKQKGDTEAFILRTDAEIKQERKRRIQIGVAKEITPGGQLELVPEADIKVVADAVKELSKTTGTLVLGEGTTQMLNIKK